MLQVDPATLYYYTMSPTLCFVSLVYGGRDIA
jgi:hypothetical protein